jgi:hypothetical protein
MIVYMVITGGSIGQLEQAVNKRCSEGWLPQGGLVYRVDIIDIWLQTMIKEVADKDPAKSTELDSGMM